MSKCFLVSTARRISSPHWQYFYLFNQFWQVLWKKAPSASSAHPEKLVWGVSLFCSTPSAAPSQRPVFLLVTGVYRWRYSNKKDPRELRRAWVMGKLFLGEIWLKINPPHVASLHTKCISRTISSVYLQVTNPLTLCMVRSTAGWWGSNGLNKRASFLHRRLFYCCSKLYEQKNVGQKLEKEKGPVRAPWIRP